jgi:hypothetical protein
MNASFNPRLFGSAARAAMFGLLVIAAALVQSREVRAQWTTSGDTTSTTNKVGIGTATPAGKLTVTGGDAIPDDTVTLNVPSASAYGPSIKLDGTNATGGRAWTIASTGPSNFGGAGKLRFYDITADATRMVLDGSGNVGIGTAQPAYHLHVYNNLNSEVFETVENGNAGATAAASILAKTNNGYAYLKMGSTAYGSWAAVGTTGTGSFYYDVFNSGGDHIWRTTASAVERMRVTNAGNVGIGTATPAAKLDVAGDIRVSGNINAKYQDVAEWVPTTQKLQPGTVVVLDAARANHVSASTAAYDTAVAGVVSAQPGLTLGEAGEGKALVATTGRVKVKVDATHAAVCIGDLLVTSDVEGVAMKSEPVVVGGRRMHAPGTIIGKALEPLAKGTGEILVLLSLQ